MVRERQATHQRQEGDEVALDARGAGPHQLGAVRVALVRQHRAAAREGVVEPREAEVRASTTGPARRPGERGGRAGWPAPRRSRARSRDRTPRRSSCRSPRRSRARRRRSGGRAAGPDPATAPDPAGDRSARAAASARRPASRSSISTYARRWCASSTGCAGWVWVCAGRMVSVSRLRAGEKHRLQVADRVDDAGGRPMRASGARRSRSPRCGSVRPGACPRAPGPTSSMTAASTFMWMSSCSGRQANEPSASRSATSTRAPSSRSASACPSSSSRRSSATWARLAATSCSARGRSISSDCDSARAASAAGDWKRPSHRAAWRGGFT